MCFTVQGSGLGRSVPWSDPGTLVWMLWLTYRSHMREGEQQCGCCGERLLSIHPSAAERKSFGMLFTSFCLWSQFDDEMKIVENEVLAIETRTSSLNMSNCFQIPHIATRAHSGCRRFLVDGGRKGSLAVVLCIELRDPDSVQRSTIRMLTIRCEIVLLISVKSIRP